MVMIKMLKLCFFTFLVSLTVILILFLKLKIQWKKTLWMILGSWLLSMGVWAVLYDIGFNPSLILFLSLEFFCVIVCISIAIIFCFFRDPERISPNQNKIIVAPADGVVRYIYPVKTNRVPVVVKNKSVIPLFELVKMHLNTPWSYLIGIEMNVLDVHVNRSPLSGVVTNQQYTPGYFYSLRKSESISKNERMVTVIQHEKFHLVVIQIASRLVRKIVSYIHSGDSVKIGQRIGMIKFGSQVDLLLPRLDHLEIMIKEGERLKSGLTIVARYG